MQESEKDKFLLCVCTVLLLLCCAHPKNADILFRFYKNTQQHKSVRRRVVYYALPIHLLWWAIKVKVTTLINNIKRGG